MEREATREGAERIRVQTLTAEERDHPGPRRTGRGRVTTSDMAL